MIPSDPYILLSYINTKLRDNFSSLDALCAALDLDREALESKLEGIDYRYDSSTNQFK